MPSTLRRSRRRELVLTQSFTRAIQDKVRLESPRVDAKECRTFFADRTNSHLQVPPASTFEASTGPMLMSRPSMMLSLHHSVDPHLPVHPIHRLPSELLVHVFTLGSRDDVMFPVLMSHVCRSWRAVTLHAHSLWRRVSLIPDTDIHMWKERIHRARRCTLDITLASSPRSGVSYDFDSVALQMHLLIPHIPQLRSLDIQFNSYAPYLWNAALGPLCRPPSHLWEHLSNYDTLEVPKLESLTLRYPQNDDVKMFSLFGGVASKLARVSLEGVWVSWHPELFGNISFLNYTHHGFSRGEEAVNEILSMLQVSSRIKELKLRVSRKTTAFQVLNLQRPLICDTTVAMPCLESLSFCVGNEDSDIPSELNSVLSRICAPTLKTLRLQDGYIAALDPLNQYFAPFAALPAFMDSAGQNVSLTNLVAEGRWIEPTLFSGLHRRLPSLKLIQVGNMVIPMGVSEM